MQNTVFTGAVPLEMILSHQNKAENQENYTKEKRVIPPSKVTPPTASSREAYFVSRQGVITIEKWKPTRTGKMENFERATIYPNQSAVYIPFGWYFVLVNPDPIHSVELEVFYF